MDTVLLRSPFIDGVLRFEGSESCRLQEVESSASVVAVVIVACVNPDVVLGLRDTKGCVTGRERGVKRRFAPIFG